jgi:hypothetical protein
MPVVEPEREPHEVRVEALSQVHLDGEGLPSRDHPPAVHEDRAREAEGDDRPGEKPELRGVVWAKRGVDHVLRDPDHGDHRALIADRESRRDGERDLVRLQEAEQAKEGLAVSNGLGHQGNLAVAPRLTAAAEPVELLVDQCGRSGDSGAICR